jgi:hypothetical protein
MNLKPKLTKYIAETLGLKTDEKSLRKLQSILFLSTRNKSKGGLRLSDQGFDTLQKADLKFYKIKLDEPVVYNNQLIIWLDHFIDCPWYITNKDIYVFGEKMAVQLVLFSGNIVKFTIAKDKSTKTA